MDKQAIRKMMRMRRRELPPAVRTRCSAEICGRILARNDVQTAIDAHAMFAVYLASPAEIDLSALIGHLWDADCPVAVPAWRGGTYELVRYARDTRLSKGPMGILEPEPQQDCGVPCAEPAVWIVPGLAFTADGARLGYGGGWYDRFLSAAAPSAVSLGVAYPFQMVDSLPVDPHDVPLTAIVSCEL